MSTSKWSFYYHYFCYFSWIVALTFYYFYYLAASVFQWNVKSCFKRFKNQKQVFTCLYDHEISFLLNCEPRLDCLKLQINIVCSKRKVDWSTFREEPSAHLKPALCEQLLDMIMFYSLLFYWSTVCCMCIVVSFCVYQSSFPWSISATKLAREITCKQKNYLFNTDLYEIETVLCVCMSRWKITGQIWNSSICPHLSLHIWRTNFSEP